MGKSRARSNSIVKVEDVGASQEQVLDQSAYANYNAEWVNRKGVLPFFQYLLHRVLTTLQVLG